MALYELEHPMGQQIEDIFTAFTLGAAENKAELLGPDAEKFDITFTDAIGTGDGTNLVRFADWKERNYGVLIQPLVIPSDEHWKIEYEGEEKRILQRMRVRDMLGRPFRVFRGDDVESCQVGYIQFDVVSDGVFMSGQINENMTLVQTGEFESSQYYHLYRIAEKIGLSALLDLAKRAA